MTRFKDSPIGLCVVVQFTSHEITKRALTSLFFPFLPREKCSILTVSRIARSRFFFCPGSGRGVATVAGDENEELIDRVGFVVTLKQSEDRGAGADRWDPFLTFPG